MLALVASFVLCAEPALPSVEYGRGDRFGSSSLSIASDGTYELQERTDYPVTPRKGRLTADEKKKLVELVKAVRELPPKPTPAVGLGGPVSFGERIGLSVGAKDLSGYLGSNAPGVGIGDLAGRKAVQALAEHLDRIVTRVTR